MKKKKYLDKDQFQFFSTNPKQTKKQKERK